MKIAVIGAGIIGVTTAFELGRDGHDVTVIEQRSAAAEEASFAHAGVMSPGLTGPWSGFGLPVAWWRQFLGQEPGLRLRWPLSSAEWGWVRQSRSAQRSGVALGNLAPLRQLALYSRERLRALCTQLELTYDRGEGCMLLFRSDSDRRRAQPHLQQLTEAGVPFGQLDAAQARKVEPALDPETPLAGAILLPDDEAGNCRQFALLLKAEAQRLGVQFLFNTRVAKIATAPQPAVMLEGEAAAHSVDAIVVCAGSASASLLAPLGIPLPLAGLHGYSLSASIREPLNAPRATVIDDHHQVVITRLGQRVRVSGGTHLGGPASGKHPATLQTLYKVLHDWFPGAANKNAGIQEWKGTSATLPDGPPVVGASGLPGLWLNLGHGAAGWSLACGSARALADEMLGHASEIDMQAFTAARWRVKR